MKWSIVVLLSSCLITTSNGQTANDKFSNTKEWGIKTQEERINQLLDWLIIGCSNAGSSCSDSPPDYRHVEYEGYDGFYNNLAKPTQGAIDTPLLRLLPSAYEDGVYMPVKRSTNPLTISDALMSGKNGQTSTAGNTAFLLFFGQQVVEEVLDAQGSACPPEYFNINIPNNHKYKTKSPKLKVMPLLRTRYDMNTGYSPNNPRQQLNEITPYIDGGLVYGIAKGWADALRLDKNNHIAEDGQLAGHSDSLLGGDFPAENSQRLPMANPPPPTNHSYFVENGQTAEVNRFFKLGNPRGNENPFLLTFGIFWYRWHNVIARFLKSKYPDWDGERIFNEARKWVIATQQSVTVYDWLPTYLKSPIDPYYSREKNGKTQGGYDPSVDPQISQIFQSAAMRFGHTLVPSGVYLRKTNAEGCDSDSYDLDSTSHSGSHGVRTCNSFWRSPELFREPKNFERFLMGMSSQSTEKEDNVIVEDLRGSVFGPLEFSRRDLMAVNIQRARDHGLPDYNTARKYFGLTPLKTLNADEFVRTTKTRVDKKVIEKLSATYDNKTDEVDIWPGGLLETTSGPGQLFTEVIKNQFYRIRNGDRFWFENKENHLFTQSEIERIKNVKIIHLLLSVANISLEDVQEFPFTAPRDDNSPTGKSCQSKQNNTVDCTYYNATTSKEIKSICKYLPALGDTNLEACTISQTYNYYTGSYSSFISSFAALFVFCVGTFFGINVWTLAIQKQKTKEALVPSKEAEGHLKCKERVSLFERRIVIISFDMKSSSILVKNTIEKVLRVFELKNISELQVYRTKNYGKIRLRAANHYDLYLICDNDFYASNFLKSLEKFCKEMGQTYIETVKSNVAIDRDIITVSDRERGLAKFMASIFDKKQNDYADMKCIQLTKLELANALGLTPDSIFLNQLFYLMDVDQDGFITAQEFAAVILKFSKGTWEEKAALLFQIYDLSHTGSISLNDFRLMIESHLGSEAKQIDIDAFISSMLSISNININESLNFTQFKNILYSNDVVRNSIKFDMKKEVSRQESAFSIYALPEEEIVKTNMADDHNLYQEDETLENIQQEKEQSMLQERYNHIINIFKAKELIIFWGAIYTLVMLLIFAERAYYYSVEREHSGLRRIAGYGVTVTRGAASAMMFTYSSLLITMCRNSMSILRSTILNRFFPFDNMVDMHKYISWWALIFTAIHIVGHAVNFYHISTQTASDLSCLFRNFYRSTHILPKFHYWCWETVTGFTGVLLTIQVAVIYIFAISARHHLFKFFWITHKSYPLFYFLTILHGCGQLVQEPFFYYFFLGPCILFTLDKIVSISRKSVEKLVWKAEHLASNVTVLHIQRPLNFTYLSGQWVRIASQGISSMEFHPFTLSSAPHEKNLTLHIRGVGPWTHRLRKVYPDCNTVKKTPNFKYPSIYLDGPFGEGHQNWYNFEVVVLVGGGIGVTPFASILKDIVYKCSQPSSNLVCKKVIFLWVTRSQKQFEWMTDILRTVEENDKKNIIRIHIFITQFKSKYDLRTMLLYHAERRFQKVYGRSMFTGLKAITHFSRPEFDKVFKAIKDRYDKIPIIGVFTCGNSFLSSAVEAGCISTNKLPGPIFKHYFENF